MTILRGSRTSVEFGPGLPVLLINNNLKVFEQDPHVLESLKHSDPTPLVNFAREGEANGCQVVDILIDHIELNECVSLPMAVQAVDQTIGCPISIDSRNAVAIDMALEGYSGKAMLNSIVYDKPVLDALLPLVQKYNTAVIAMLVDDVRIPETWQERLAIAHKILAITDDAGIPREDVVFDCVCLAASVAPNSMRATLDTLKAIHEELGMSTMLGIGNAGFGMPDKTRLDLLYLTIGASWGLDAALVDYRTENLALYASGINFLTGRDPHGQAYIAYHKPTGGKSSRRARPRQRT